MAESPTQSAKTETTNELSLSSQPEIPVEIVSDEEMALIEAALAAAAAAAATSSTSLISCASSSSSSSQLRGSMMGSVNRTTTLLSNRMLSRCSSTDTDIEDIGKKRSFGVLNNQQQEAMKNGDVKESLLQRFRRRGFSVTDLTATEWCEKQMEFSLLRGKPKKTKAMKAGSARHVALEEEVIKRVKVEVKSQEDVWALKLMNFVVCANQLLFDGLTRELPVIGVVEGIWIIGVIDEIRMPSVDGRRFPTLVDTKTRVQPTLPAEPQRRNGRLQLMCYKHLWDTLVADKFPSGPFFDFFSLNPKSVLSAEIRQSTAASGFPSETLNDLVKYFKNTCSTLPPSNDELLLRYELQEDQSLIGEDLFAHDPEWLKHQINNCLEFWMGDREAQYVSEEERWKCRSCKFNSVCPITEDSTPT